MRALMIFIAFSAKAQSNLDSLVVKALAHNPMLHAVSHKMEAAEAAVDQAGAWDPPQIGIEFFRVPVSSFPIPTKGNMEMDYFVRQTIPWPGKTLRMTRMAEQTAQMEVHSVRALQLDIIRTVKSMYYDLFLIDRELEINTEARTLLRGLVTGILREIEVGHGKQTQLWRLQSEIARLDNDSLKLSSMRVRTESDLNAMMNRSIESPIRPDSMLTVPAWAMDESLLMEQALASRPELKSLDNMRQMFLEEKKLAGREAYPNIMLEGMYKNMTRTSRDFWSLMIGIDVPIAFWSKGRYRAKELESEQHIRHAEMEKVALSQEIKASVRRLASDVRAATGQMNISRNRVIPYAQQAIDAVMADFQTGRASITDVLERQRDLLEAKKEYYANLAGSLKSVAELERAIGTSEGGRHD